MLLQRQFIFIFVIILFMFSLWRIWKKKLDEDLIIYILKRNGGFLKRDEVTVRIYDHTMASFNSKERKKIDGTKIKNSLYKDIEATLISLNKKKIIEIKDNVVYLIDDDYKTAFRDEP